MAATAKEAAPSFDLAALKALFSETLEEQMAPLRETIAQLEAKVSEQDKMIPKFIKAPRRENPSGMPHTPAEHMAAMAGMKPGDTNSQTIHQMIVTQNGKRMDQGAMAALFASYQPQFQPGDRVRINPDSERRGWAPGKTWADVLPKTSNPDGEGEIMEVTPFSHRGWMYRVAIKGHGEAGRGMVFDQHELLSA